MSLDIILSINGKSPVYYNPETSISFDDDADYWYLWPTMIQEIYDQTGEMIDLYDNAEFSGEDLDKVEKLILKALGELDSRKEDTRDVSIGVVENNPISRTLIKKDLQLKLQTFLKAVRSAKETNERIICMGD